MFPFNWCIPGGKWKRHHDIASWTDGFCNEENVTRIHIEVAYPYMQLMDTVSDIWVMKHKRYTFFVSAPRKCLAIRGLTLDMMNVFILYLVRVLKSQSLCQVSLLGPSHIVNIDQDIWSCVENISWSFNRELTRIFTYTYIVLHRYGEIVKSQLQKHESSNQVKKWERFKLYYRILSYLTFVFKTVRFFCFLVFVVQYDKKFALFSLLKELTGIKAYMLGNWQEVV